jgi:hypothetical protein
LSNLMTRVVQDSIAEYTADADNAGLTYDLDASLTGLKVNKTKKIGLNSKLKMNIVKETHLY